MSDRVYVGLDIADFRNLKAGKPISKVTLMYDEEHGFSAGDDTGLEIVAACYFATQAMVDNALAVLQRQQYQAFTAEATGLDPAAELGDAVSISGIYAPLVRRTDSGYGFPDIEAPGEEELEDGDQNEGYLTREVKRKVTLGADYFGSRITRKSGLQVVKYDADGSEIKRATFNADVLEMCDEDGTPCVYFDTEEKKFRFVGDLDVSGGVLSAVEIRSSSIYGTDIYGGRIFAVGEEDEYYAQMLENSFALMGTGSDVPRAALTATETMVELSLGVGDEVGNGRFYVRKGYGSVNGSATQNFALLQFNDVNGNNSMIVFTDNDGILVDADPIAFYGTVDFTNATVLGLTASGGEGLSGETVTIKATHQVKITASDDINVQSDEDVNFAADYDIVFSAIQSNDEGEQVSMRLSADYQRIHFSIGSTVWVLDETGLWKL